MLLLLSFESIGMLRYLQRSMLSQAVMLRIHICTTRCASQLQSQPYLDALHGSM